MRAHITHHLQSAAVSAVRVIVAEMMVGGEVFASISDASFC
jgi:hypothetical protein